MESLFADLRYALRTLRKSPGFATAAVLTLALGIGATTAIFSVLEKALLRRLPVEAPDRLVHAVTDRGEAGINYNLSYPAFEELRDQAQPFQGVLAYTRVPLALGAGEGVDRVQAAAVSGRFFEVLGLEPGLGRWFSPEEDLPGSPVTVVVLSHDFWSRRLGGDRDVLGRSVTLNQRAFTVIGVAPRPFAGLLRGSPDAAWIPLAALETVAEVGQYVRRRQASWLDVFARLSDGVTREQAQAALAVFDAARRSAGTLPEGQHTLLLDGSAGLTYHVDAVARPLTILMVAAGLILLIASANLAGLLLTRAGARRREIAIRLSLGARRSRLVRQLLTESVLLAVLGGTAGLAVAVWVGDLLLAYRPPGGDPLALERGRELAKLVFAAALALATGLAFGLVPALRASRPTLVPALAGASGDAAGLARRLGWGGTLVVAQVALSLVLLVGSGLLVRTLRNLSQVEVGYDPRGVLLASLELESRGYESARWTTFAEDLLARVGAVPGVERATLASTVNPTPGGSNWSGLTLEGYTPAEGEEIAFDVNFVGPGYFETLRIPLVRGRALDQRDRLGAPAVAVINQTVARRYWPDRDPVGRRIFIGTDTTAPSVEIVGVAGDGKYRDLREAPAAMVYFPILRRAQPLATLLIRTGGDPLAFAGRVREAVRAVDPAIPIYDLRTLDAHVGFASSRERMAASFVLLFGLLALALAAVGVYGVVAFAVGRRVREIGVRVALGSTPRQVQRLFLARAAALVAVGLGLGILGTVPLARQVSEFFYGVSATDPATYIGVPAFLAAIALLAAYLPARRAARVDPVTALRTE